ncbi:glycosyltransferase family 4 protein [Phycisphaera mikurensis]|uniref:Putative glycosyltransferase n=1 Tax=Phycisphaera mikurensis (strain NBRC 102666 / KCTC 22515 / FYK2301M01) TaxID=1142394 RepID=I0II32_PHYMF|nr:glycosyltransferase family 4 protein [Phycisphaera mikurensis]MBB6442517.1 glycosyltransferase involved in cell wall biosynthesis [Phycisphaera mikurensis]BAM04920.1 putative glycosyltransferase [Phycisphaera mikurensis NBRC 102666]
MTDPLRILHVITRLIVGGAQMNTVLCAKAQAEAGHEVHIAHGPDEGPEGSLEAEAEAAGARLHLTPSLVRAVSPAADRRCLRDLKATVRGLKPDVVHTHSSKAGILGRAAAWAVRERDRPLILHTVHGLPWNDAMNPLKRRLYVALERWAARRCDHLIAITPAMVDAFVAAGVTTRERFTVIPSGVDLRPFLHGPTPEEARRALGLADGPWIGLVARLDRLKGHADLFRAWPAIRAAVPGARLLLVGDGPDAAEIRAAGEGLDGLRWLGRTETGDMPAVYRALDACVLPSHQEGQSRVLVEALAAGCPAVAYRVGGMPDVLDHGRAGTLVERGDTAGLAAAVIAVLRTDSRVEVSCEHGRAHVQRSYSVPAMTDALEALIQRRAAGRVKLPRA